MKKILAFLLCLRALPAAAQFASVSQLQLPSTTTAYTAGQLMATSATGTSAVVPSFTINASSSFGVIPRLRVRINDTLASSWNGQSLTIDLWSAAPTFAAGNGDRSTFLPATGSGTHLGSYSCSLSIVAGDGVWGECAITVGQYITFQAIAPTRIYWTAIAATGSGTVTASDILYLYPEVVF